MSRLVCVLLVMTRLTPAILAQVSPSLPRPSHVQSPAPDLGQITNGVYRNTLFGLSYKLPYGWVDRTADMRRDDDAPTSSDPAKALVLLAEFERPPEARSDTVNSSVVFAAESTASYPGLKNAAQYFKPLAEVTSQQGFKALGEPYEFPVDARDIVRCDYTKSLAGLTVHQSTLVLLSKGYVISLTFVAGDDEAVTALIEGVSLAKVRLPSHP